MYLYYELKTHNLADLNVGTAVPSLTTNILNEIEIDLPSIETQQKIASVLSALDAKIELNAKLNALLEELVETLFTRMLKTNRETTSLGSYIDITSGKRPIARVMSKKLDCSVPILGASCQVGYTNNFLTNEKLLIIGRVGTHGIVQRVNEPAWPSDNTLVIKAKFYEFIFRLLKHVDYSALNRGSTQPLITQKDLANYRVPKVAEEDLLEFENRVSDVMHLFDRNKIESRHLATLRDTLLPKLMSGEIDFN